MHVLVSAYPFLNKVAARDGIEFVYHPWNRKPKPEEILEEMVRGEYAGLIAGTERLENAIADQARALKVVSRVGSGLDNLDVEYFAARGIQTAFTPFGPVDAVAELTVAMMLDALRNVLLHDRRVRGGEWKRDFGGRLSDCCVGIVGFGRIGRRVAVLLLPFRGKLLLHDTAPDLATAHALGLHFVDKPTLLRESDVVTLHVPLKSDTRGWLGQSELSLCRPDVVVVNAARGGIVDESAMLEFLQARPATTYCSDAFVTEPYAGPLSEVQNTLLFPHIGASTVGSRRAMEQGALDNCVKLLRGEACADLVTKNVP